MKKYLSTIAIVSLLMTLFYSCDKDDKDDVVASLPVITTCDITNVKDRSAICGGNITDDGGANIIERGICYSTKPNPTLSDSHIADVGKESGSFIMDITDLAGNTQYYVRAYATNAAGTSLGEEKSFRTTFPDDFLPTGRNDNHESVNLGLSVDWATCNVGANGPEEPGYYVAWGETAPKSYYDWDTYRFCEGANPKIPNWPKNLAKYNNNPEYGTVDNETFLHEEDDIVHKEWGILWRMPYEEDWRELIDKCTWDATFYRGSYGFKVTGKNGNSIFLPVWGYIIGNRNPYRDMQGYYWSGSLDKNNVLSAYNLSLFYHLKSKTYEVEMRTFMRRWGLNVRPVRTWVVY